MEMRRVNNKISISLLNTSDMANVQINLHKMNEEAISYIMQKMSNCLDNSGSIGYREKRNQANILTYVRKDVYLF